MFSANENLMLRQHKRRIVSKIESTMSEDALDYGTSVMVMQVSCKAPGCVPLETAVVIIFPKSTTELVPGLPESKDGGNYKTKILKPMADVTDDDILESLPPAFEGGKRTMEKLCVTARDVMLAQITQLFGEDDPNDKNALLDRTAMAEYLQDCLSEYIARGCKAPEYGEPFPELTKEQEEYGQEETQQQQQDELEKNEEKQSSSVVVVNVDNDGYGDDGSGENKNDESVDVTTNVNAIPKTGNFVIRRVLDNNNNNNISNNSVSKQSTSTSVNMSNPSLNSSSTTTAAAAATNDTSANANTVNSFNSIDNRNTVNGQTRSVTRMATTTTTTTTTTSIRNTTSTRRHQSAIQRALVNGGGNLIGGGVGGGSSSRSSNRSRLFDREHAPGIRQAGCPCCDPDNPSTLVDNMMML